MKTVEASADHADLWQCRTSPPGAGPHAERRTVVSAAREPALQEARNDAPEEDLEAADWRFLLPFSPGARVLWLGARDPAALARTAPHRRLVVQAPWSGRAAGGAAAPVAFRCDRLPFRAASFDLVALDLALEAYRSERLARAFAELSRVLEPGGALHVGVPGWSNGSPAPSRSRLAGMRSWRIRLGGWTRVRRVVAALRISGFERMELFARLPSHDRPRYLVRCEDLPSVEFVLSRLPTSTKLSALSVRAIAVFGSLFGTVAPISPGVSVVARRSDR